MPCPDAKGLLEGYAARALGDAERRLVDEHLESGCDACRRDLADLTIAAHSLAADLEPLAPPASLKAGLMDRIADAEVTVATDALAAPTPREQRRSWRTYLIVATAAAVLGVLAALPQHRHEPPGAALAQSEFDAYRRRISETNRALGLSQRRIVQVSSQSVDPEFRPRLLFDEVSSQLHLLVPNASLPKPAESCWAWVQGGGGGLLTSARLQPISDAYSGAVLDLPDRGADARRLLLTVETSDAPRAPSTDTFGGANLTIPRDNDPRP